MSERSPFTLLGLNFGTASGWDSYGDNGLIFYEVEPSAELRQKLAGLPLSSFALAFDPESGIIQILDETNEEKQDILSFQLRLVADVIG